MAAMIALELHRKCHVLQNAVTAEPSFPRRLLQDLPPEQGRVLRRQLLTTASSQFEAGWGPASVHAALLLH